MFIASCMLSQYWCCSSVYRTKAVR